MSWVGEGYKQVWRWMRGIAQGSGGRGRGEMGEGAGERVGASFSREALVLGGQNTRTPLGPGSPLSCSVTGWWTVPFGPGSLLCKAVAGAVPQGGPRMRGGAVLVPSGGP